MQAGLAIGMAMFMAGAEAHVHGLAHLDVVAEDHRLSLTLHGAGDNFVGFEHAAETPEQIAAVGAAHTRLQSLDALLGLEKGCRRESVTVSLPSRLGLRLEAGEWRPVTIEAETAHVEHDHHDHPITSGERHPSDWWIEASLVCAHDQPGRSLDANALFAAFPRLHELKVQAIGPAGQAGGLLKADTTTLVLP